MIFIILYRYYQFDAPVIREVLGKKLTSRHRKDLDDVSEKTGIPLRSCRRQVHRISSYLKKPTNFEEGRKEMFYLMTHSTHFIYGYMASDIWLRTILIVRKKTRCRHIGYSLRLTARVLLYAQDSTYQGLCYTSHGALAGTRNSSVGSPHEGSIWRPIAPWANALPLSYVTLPLLQRSHPQPLFNNSLSCLLDGAYKRSLAAFQTK